MTNGSLMKVEVLQNAPFAFCNTFDLHYPIIGIKKTIFFLVESGHFTQVLLHLVKMKRNVEQIQVTSHPSYQNRDSSSMKIES